MGDGVEESLSISVPSYDWFLATSVEEDVIEDVTFYNVLFSLLSRKD